MATANRTSATASANMQELEQRLREQYTTEAQARLANMAIESRFLSAVIEGAFGNSSAKTILGAMAKFVTAETFATAAKRFNEVKKLSGTGQNIEAMESACVAARIKRDEAQALADNAKSAYRTACDTAESDEDFDKLPELKRAHKKASDAVEPLAEAYNTLYVEFCAVNPAQFTANYNRLNNKASALRNTAREDLMRLCTDNPLFRKSIAQYVKGTTFETEYGNSLTELANVEKQVETLKAKAASAQTSAFVALGTPANESDKPEQSEPDQPDVFTAIDGMEFNSEIELIDYHAKLIEDGKATADESGTISLVLSDSDLATA